MCYSTLFLYAVQSLASNESDRVEFIHRLVLNRASQLGEGVPISFLDAFHSVEDKIDSLPRFQKFMKQYQSSDDNPIAHMQAFVMCIAILLKLAATCRVLSQNSKQDRVEAVHGIGLPEELVEKSLHAIDHYFKDHLLRNPTLLPPRETDNASTPSTSTSLRLTGPRTPDMDVFMKESASGPRSKSKKPKTPGGRTETLQRAFFAEVVRTVLHSPIIYI